MTLAARWLAGVGATAFTVGAGCSRSIAENPSAETARQASQVAVSTDQARLWREVADKDAAPGLNRIPTVQPTLERRERRPSPPGSPSPPSPQAPVRIPQGVQSAIRILAYPINPAESYTGQAKVIEVRDDDQIRLDLGPRGMLTALVRAGGKPLRVASGDPVLVTYQSRQDPRVPADVIAVQTATGHGIAQVIQGGDDLVRVVIPLFGLTARQTDYALAPAVEIGSGRGVAQKKMGVGMTAQVGDAMVLILGSSGAPKGADVGRAEGSAYVLNVLVWKVP